MAKVLSQMADSHSTPFIKDCLLIPNKKAIHDSSHSKIMETWTRVAAEEMEKSDKDDGCILEAQSAEVTGGVDVGDKARAEIEVNDM